MKEQMTDVDAVQSKEVHLFWSGMAEVSEWVSALYELFVKYQ